MAGTRTIADIIADIAKIDDEVTRLNKESKDLAKTRIPLEAELKLAADAVQLTAGKSSTFKWEIVAETVPQAADWEEFYEYIKENNYFHLLQKRPTTLACQELWSQGKVIPGIEKFTKQKINVKGI